MYNMEMSEKWKIIYYEDSLDKSEVFDFINNLKENHQAKVLAWLSLLEEKGPNLPRPYSDILDDGIHELRIKLSGNQIRILYFFCYKEFIVLTNYFTKKSEKVPKDEILKAIDCRNDLLKRYDSYKKLLEVYNENS